MSENQSNDKQQILDHIHSIFQAFIKQDRDTLRETHADNWIGFLGPSTSIEKGIDAYMANAEKSLQNFKGTGYEISESEIQVFGDMALVFYVARYDYEDISGHAHSLPLRSIDIYRRDKDSWIQAGSHISVIPNSGEWGEGDKN
jgi:ketosteroid isomerase-like protein